MPPGVFQLTQMRRIRRSCLTTPIPRAPCIACSRCGRSSIAPPARRPRPTRRAARHNLFAWVEHTVGAGSNGAAPPSGGYAGEGSTSPLFFNMQTGDVPYLKSLADDYTMSDNYHQAVLGGTGANHVMLGTGDADLVQRREGHSRSPAEQSRRSRESRTALARAFLRSVGNRKPGPDAGHEQLLHPGRLRRRLGQPGGEAAQRELRRRFLRQLRGLDPARRRGGQRLSRRAEAPASSPTARPATTISSTTTIPVISATARTRIRIPIRTITYSPSRRQTCATSATSFLRLIFRGLISAISSTSTSRTLTG